MENKVQLNILINKYLNRQCTADEFNLLLQAFNVHEDEDELKKCLLTYFETETDYNTPDVGNVLNEVHNNLIQKITKPVPVIKMQPRLNWLALAAVLLLFIFSGAYIYLNPSLFNTKITPALTGRKINDVKPGGNKAILTLVNGQRVVLNDLKTGVVATQGNTSIIKTNSGQIVNQLLNNNVQDSPSLLSYNTIETPRGGQYQIVLPDGTKVWLNAASVLKYPTRFIGKERKVELSGEAYFEVAKNASMPFKVSSAGQVVEVLGTHFNINAYADESLMRTTLLEGSVKINYKQASSVLRPGEQAQISNKTTNDINVIKNTDLDEATAWRDGYFQFNHADIKTVMLQISRWYDVDVKYEGNIPSVQFGGAIERSLNLSQLLKILEKNQLKFIITGKEVRVMQ